MKDSALSTRVPSLRVTSASSNYLPNDSRVASADAGTSSALQPFDGISEPGPSNAVTAGGGPTSLAMRRKEQAYFFAACCSLFLAGWNELSSDPAVFFLFSLSQLHG